MRLSPVKRGNKKMRSEMKKKRRIVEENLVPLKNDDRSFDFRFWRKAGAEAVFSAAWDMVLESQAFRGQHEGQSRLQRSVENMQIIGKNDLMRSKRKAGRDQDLLDLKRLREAK